MSERPTLVLVPGLLCDATTFGDLPARLADIVDCIIPDLRGFDDIGAMARAVLDQAPARFAVLGFSMGGRVALQMMRLAPERVSHLGLMDTGAGPARPEEAANRGALVALAREAGMEALAARWLPPMLHPDRVADAALVGTLTEMVCRSTPESYAGQIRALLGRPDSRAVLPTISCPTLVVCGAQDAWATPAQHEELAAGIPGARLAMVEGSGHFLPVEAPAALAALLREWLAAPDTQEAA